MPKRKPPSQLSGAEKLKRSGRKAVMLAVSVDELQVLRGAAARERRPLSSYIVFHALQAAVVGDPYALSAEDVDPGHLPRERSHAR